MQETLLTHLALTWEDVHCENDPKQEARITELLNEIGVPPEKHQQYREDLVGIMYTLVDGLFRETMQKSREQAQLPDGTN